MFGSLRLLTAVGGLRPSLRSPPWSQALTPCYVKTTNSVTKYGEIMPLGSFDYVDTVCKRVEVLKSLGNDLC